MLPGCVRLQAYRLESRLTSRRASRLLFNHKGAINE